MKSPLFDRHQFQPTFGWPFVYAPEDSGLAIEDAWPTLYAGIERVEEIKRKTETLPWARNALTRWKMEAELILKEKPDFVTGAQMQSSAYSRFENGRHLPFDPFTTDSMWDPLEGAFVPMENTHAAWRYLSHERIRCLMTSLGFLYQITKDERYSKWVWEAFRRAAALYANPSLCPSSANLGHAILYDYLFEAKAQIQFAQAFDLIRHAPGGTAEDAQAVEKNILLASGEVLSKWMDVMSVHNMSCWGMAALGVLGKTMKRRDWIEKAIHSKRSGLSILIQTGIPRDPKTGKPDGFWHETATFYNFFAGVPLVTLFRIGEEEGAVDDDLRERFRIFFEAPLHLVDSELRLLSVGDRLAPGQLDLPRMRHVYEYAAGQVDPKRFGPVLAMLYEHCGAQRTSLAALAWGPDSLPPACQPPTESSILSVTRMAILRKRTPKHSADIWFLGGEDNHGGQGHHHNDKLSFSLVADGEIVSMDPGLTNNHDKTWTHFLQGTFSHNTLLVDECDQGAMESMKFETDISAPVPWVHSAVRGNREGKQSGIQKTLERISERVKPGVYDGVTLERTLHFDHPFIILSDRCVAPDAKRFGVAFHAYGTMVAATLSNENEKALSLPPLPQEGYYTLFKGRANADPVRLFVADWRIKTHLWLRLLTVSDGPFEAIWGRTPANPKTESRGSILLRAPGKERRFATALELHRGTPSLREVKFGDQNSIVAVMYDGTVRTYPAKSC